MSGRYAANTGVPVERSRGEVEKILARYGADGFAYARDDVRGTTTIGFRAEGRCIKIVLPIPSRQQFTHSETGRVRSQNSADSAWEAACRQGWRALALIIKAKLEAVASGIVTFDDEFMPYVVLPDGNTVGEWMRPQIAKAIEGGKMPKQLMW